MKSLRLRLILLLFVGLGVAWLVSALFTLLESREEINRLFDAQLAQSAQVLLGTTGYEIHERIEHGDDEVQVTHEYEQRLAFQIWNARDLLLRSSNAPVSAMSAEDGYSETTISAQTWRVLTKWDSNHEFMIQVAEPLAGRERLARHITLKMLMPTLAAVPVLGLLIWFGIGAGLRPLNNLKNEVTQRAANQLAPLQMTEVPEEVAPLVKSLNALFARLKLAFESERRFTADAAHELRTPLAALKIQAQVALRSANETERNVALEHVLQGVNRATRLVEQLLTLARVDPENAFLDFQQVDLHSLAASIMADMEPLAHAKQIELQLERDNTCYVNGESTQLGLLLRNLIDNAIRYTPAGGQVSVIIRNNDGIKLQVRDTGLGIAKAEREQVLKRFYRITGNGQEGSGLGLSIVRRIAELHGASIKLSDNDAGQGLLVSVIWPNHNSDSTQAWK